MSAMRKNREKKEAEQKVKETKANASVPPSIHPDAQDAKANDNAKRGATMEDRQTIEVPSIRVFNADNKAVQLEAGNLSLGADANPLISVVPAGNDNKANFRIVYNPEGTAA